QLVHLAMGRANLDTRELIFVPVYGHRGVRRLVGVESNHYVHDYLLGCSGTPRGHSCLQTVCARSSFEPLRGEARAGGSSNESQPVHTGGRHFVSYPARTSERYGLTTTSAYILKQAHRGHVPLGYDGVKVGHLASADNSTTTQR